MTLGEAIREVRKKKGIDQCALARMVEMTQTTISQIETGNKRPGPKTLKKIAYWLDTPEAIFHMMSLDISQVANEDRVKFDILWPIITDLLNKLVTLKPKRDARKKGH